jgi:hypothetical protein
MPFVKPGKVTALKVKGKAKANKRKVTWRAPLSDGGTAVTGYHVVVKKRAKVLLTKNVGAAKHAVKLRKSKLATGKLKVFVSAANAVGTGPAAKKKFRVR